MKCKKCGFENITGSAFCCECGAKLDNTVKCPKCDDDVPMGQKFCGNCGYKIPSVDDYPKSKELTGRNGIQSKMVCSCGSIKFLSDKIVVGGYNGSSSGIEIIRYNYVCGKCGAEVYHSHDDNGEYFVFVPKDKAKEARALSDFIGVTVERSFGRDFCISTRWDDILVNTSYGILYDYMNHVLDNPNRIVAGYCTKDRDGSDLEADVAKRTWEKIREQSDDEEFMTEEEWEREYGKKRDVNGDIMTALDREMVIKAFRFGPASSFAIDIHGKLSFNNDRNLEVPEGDFADDFYEPSRKFHKVLKTYNKIQDKFISTNPIAPEKTEAVLKKMDVPLNFYFANVIVENTLWGGDLVVIAKNNLWCKSKFASTRIIRIKKLEQSELRHEKGSMVISLGDEKLHLKGPSSESVDKLFEALKMHWEFLNGIYD